MSAGKLLKTCGRCGAGFDCGMHGGACWCEALPRVVPVEPSGSCLCPACLTREIGGRIGRFLAETPHEEALRAARAEPEGRPFIEGIDYTMENGMMVLSAWYLLKRGECCGSGCRNCPYPPAQ